MGKAIILDSETTGLPPKGEACEIAFMQIHTDLPTIFNEVLDNPIENSIHIIQRTFEQRYMPKGDFHPKASECNGFTKEKLAGSPCISTFKFPEDVEYMVGHNANFDHAILKHPKVKLICTKELATKYLTKKSGAGTKGVNTLTGLIERYYPEEAKELIANAHSALQDCKLTYLLLLKILEAAPELDSFEKLAMQCKQPSDKPSEAKLPYMVKEHEAGYLYFTFGKYQGVPLDKLVKDNKSYLTWIVEKSTMNQGLKDWVKDFMRK